MQNISKTFLTQDEQAQINGAVHLAEKQTSGEIVPMIVSSSYHYPAASIIGSLVFSSGVAFLLNSQLATFFSQHANNLLLFFAIFCPLFPLFYWLISTLPAVKRFFLSPAQMNEEVQEGATTAFFTEELYKTRDENGVLLYLSLFEKRAWILGDKGVNEKIEQKEWDDVVDILTQGIKSGNQCEAICVAVERVGQILKEHFPAKKDDTNELHNLIIK